MIVFVYFANILCIIDTFVSYWKEKYLHGFLFGVIALAWAFVDMLPFGNSIYWLAIPFLPVVIRDLCVLVGKWNVIKVNFVIISIVIVMLVGLLVFFNGGRVLEDSSKQLQELERMLNTQDTQTEKNRK